MPKQKHYDRVAEELRQNEIHDGLWARAYSESRGDVDNARAFYIHFRADMLEHDERAIRSRRWLMFGAAFGTVALGGGIVTHTLRNKQRAPTISSIPLVESVSPTPPPSQAPTLLKPTPAPTPTPYTADPDFIAGIAAQRDKLYEAAIQNFQKASQRYPREPRIHERLGLAYTRAERYLDSAREYEQALAIDPESHLALNNVAVAFRLAGQHQRAIEAYKRVLLANPNDDAAWFFVGVSHMILKENSEAEDAFLRSAAISPDFAGTWFNLGIVCQRQSSFGHALQAYARSLQLDPRQDDVWSRFNALYEKHGTHWPKVQAYLAAPTDQLIRAREEATRAAMLATFDLFPQMANSTDPLRTEFLETYERAKRADPDGDGGLPWLPVRVALKAAQGRKIAPILRRADLVPKGTMNIRNGTPSPAIVKLVDVASNKLSKVVLVPSEGSQSLSGIADGFYIVLYAFGDRYDAAAKGLVGNLHAARFEKAIGFATHEEIKGDKLETTFVQQTLKLHPVIGGNAKTRDIPLKAFLAY